MTAKLCLAKGEERRLKAGHLWIYADEVARLDPIEPGELVHVQDHRGHLVGTAYANPASKIIARMMSRKALPELKPSWWMERLQTALAWREWMHETPHYRWIHGEGDKLPGLVIDRFGEDIVIQSHTAGIDAQMDTIIQAVSRLVSPQAIYLNNRASSRRHEGIDRYARLVHGRGSGQVQVVENGAVLNCDALTGQKTGYFYDQRPNRTWVGKLCAGREVLDLFAYVGAFAVQALQGGARHVTSVDASQTALDWACRNVARLGAETSWEGIRGDVPRILQELGEQKRRFDIVICDPPAFVKSRSKRQAGLRGYQRLARSCATLVRPGGLLCTASCSGLISLDEFRLATLKGIREAGRSAQIVHVGEAGADHPWLPAMPEMRYLKFMAWRLD